MSPVLSVVALEAIAVVLTTMIADVAAWAGATGNNAKSKPAIKTEALRFMTTPKTVERFLLPEYLLNLKNGNYS